LAIVGSTVDITVGLGAAKALPTMREFSWSVVVGVKVFPLTEPVALVTGDGPSILPTLIDRGVTASHEIALTFPFVLAFPLGTTPLKRGTPFGRCGSLSGKASFGVFTAAFRAPMAGVPTETERVMAPRAKLLLLGHFSSPTTRVRPAWEINSPTPLTYVGIRDAPLDCPPSFISPFVLVVQWIHYQSHPVRPRSRLTSVDSCGCVC
jgi:hypothetical protein